MERLTSAWGSEGPSKFATLADAMAGWEAYEAGSPPEMTGRIFARDGGVDGKVDVQRPLGGLLVGCADSAYLARMRQLRYPPDRVPDFDSIGRRLGEEGERLLNRLRPTETDPS